MYDTRAPFVARQAGFAGRIHPTLGGFPPPTRLQFCATPHGPCLAVESTSADGWLLFGAGILVGAAGALALLAAADA